MKVPYVVSDVSFDDWIVRDHRGCELGRYLTGEAGDLATTAVVKMRAGEIIVHLPLEAQVSRTSVKQR
jgi:hypothetical protein